MKKRTRERISQEQLMYEKKAVQIFCLLRTRFEPHKITPVAKLFDAYRDFCSDNTEISIDGFGRLLPKQFKRKSHKVDGVTARVVTGIVLI